MRAEHDVLREIENALDITPSPAFEVRVRARVHAESVRARRWIWMAGFAVAATAVLAMMLVPQKRAQSPHPSDLPPVTAEAPVVAPGIPAPQTARAGSTPRARMTRRKAHEDTDLASPAVIVPEGQLAAIERLAAIAAAGRIVMSPEPTEPPAVLQIAVLDTVAPIAFDTIQFKPLSADESPDLWR